MRLLLQLLSFVTHHSCCIVGCRRNQKLEQDSVAMREEKMQLQTEAQAMAERLHAVVQDKFRPVKSQFDADTPIDKALSFLQSCIKVTRISCFW